jgi:hypothetical protein
MSFRFDAPHFEAVILLGGIGFQPVRNTGKMTGWKPIPQFFHNLFAKRRFPFDARSLWLVTAERDG